MASAGQFVRERIPIPASVPEAGRLVLELIASSRDSQAEAAGPMTFRVVRRFRPTWASALGFLIAPLFVRNTEVCRVAVIEARVGAELLLEGTIDPELHERLVHLGRVPEAARVATLGPRPVPQVISPHAAAPGPAPQPRPLPPPPSGYPAAHRPDVVDLRDSARSIDPVPARTRHDEFADLVPPPLLPPDGGRPQPPAGPAPSFAPHDPAPHAPGNGNGSSNGRLPSAFRSPRDAVQPEGMIAAPPPPPSAPPSAPPGSARQPGWPPVPAAPDMPPNDLFTPPTRIAPSMGQQPGAPRVPRIAVSVDTGEQGTLDRLLIVGRAPTRQPAETDAVLLSVNDPSLSVSKTHLAIELDAAGLWVTDRNSTNGTWIDEGRGALRPVPAGQRTPVPPGARVLIGERVLTFTRQ
ncbi:MAG: FHA domain-containing protein [Kineosporiaceae bacterium]|nr:FHA domain-containing protein [Kineosporiaceae bacterium]